MRKLLTILLILMNITLTLGITVQAETEEITPDNLISEAVILMDANSGQILYEKNARVPLYPASLTKIATAIYAIENGDMDDIVTISENAWETEGTRVYLEVEEKVSLKKLIQGLLINSGNDAGVAIAEHLDGSIEQFAESINTYLKDEIGVQDSHFVNPHGLFDPNHQTTAADLAKMTKYAMKNEKFREIIGTKQLEWNGESWATTLFHHHKLMRENPYEGVTGGKTGFVDESGHTLMTTAERENISLIVITLQNPLIMDGYNDTIQLLDYGFENFETNHIEKGTEYEDENGKVYQVSKNLYFTREKNESVSTEVNGDGELSIFQNNSLLNITFQLNKEDQEKKQQSKEEVINDEVSKASATGFNMYLILPILLVGLMLFLIIKRKLKYR
ncbi:D-alanyl-D-alanine carboxypeptidase family protein [Aquibacillus rhizosphaerae]|uniref:D-alanyl-D-alanine carboxypeptidase family protein n=1 Tax=Aquibacillus rhizosphaerae TaxID=3051431 RepID=A0ABT7L0H9_9BACI|nr:D-alanyl-D-alanine carboxypeptidase family protein [Aquibacillus sp. LR5S19]MDL4839336.1 D-alanyl-D-alanine carboxypeptidase family protein [Aquibacillus sp. LR5S19]